MVLRATGPVVKGEPDLDTISGGIPSVFHHHDEWAASLHVPPAQESQPSEEPRNRGRAGRARRTRWHSRHSGSPPPSHPLKPQSQWAGLDGQGRAKRAALPSPSRSNVVRSGLVHAEGTGLQELVIRKGLWRLQQWAQDWSSGVWNRPNRQDRKMIYRGQQGKRTLFAGVLNA